MIETPQPLQDRPLVTFALFAYNQEKYIREAVEGALSQTYEPLEIILSDDCSSDRTFEIIQEMAAAYEGPHEVRVRQSEVNLGTLNHILEVSNVVASEVIVVAAGDDISLPNRTSVLSSVFTDLRLMAVSSDDYVVDPDGTPLEIDVDRIDKRTAWHTKYPTWIHGATAAYRTQFLQKLPKSEIKLLFEDMIISDIIKGTDGKALRLNDKLIKYRYHDKNLSSRHEKNAEEAEVSAIIRWQRAAEAKQYCISTLTDTIEPTRVTKILLGQLYSEMNFFLLLSSWPTLSLLDRFRLIKLSKERGQLRTALIRVFGSSMFYFFRFVITLFSTR